MPTRTHAHSLPWSSPPWPEYEHLGYFHKVRGLALCYLCAKFATLQSDPLLAQLSAATLVDVVRMVGQRLGSLAQVGVGRSGQGARLDGSLCAGV